jgi:hypothetical protein
MIIKHLTIHRDNKILVAQNPVADKDNGVLGLYEPALKNYSGVKTETHDLIVRHILRPISS